MSKYYPLPSNQGPTYNHKTLEERGRRNLDTEVGSNVTMEVRCYAADFSDVEIGHKECSSRN